MTETSSSTVACLIVTTSGRVLVLWDQDDTLPFQYPQLAMLLASLFHFSQAQSFGHLELQNGFTVLVSSDVEAQVSVAVICAIPVSGHDHDAFSAEVAPLQLGRFKSLIILQEFVRCYRGDIERLAVESVEQAKLQAEEYTLTSALGGFQDGEGTLDEFVAFQSGFVTPVMETTARGILNSILSWSHDSAVSLAQSSSAIRVARGFLMNAETGSVVYSTQPASDDGFFGQDPASRRLHYLHQSARVQQLIKRVSKALHESAPILISIAQDNNNNADAQVIVRFKHLSGKDLSELYVALRVLPTGVFSSCVVFYGDNKLFRGRESELFRSGKLHQALADNPSGKRMLNVLHDPSVDMDLHVGSDGAPEEVWRAMDMLVQPLMLTWSPTAVKLDSASSHSHDGPIDLEPYSTSPRLPQDTEQKSS